MPAVTTVEIRYGFIMNWMGHQKVEGHEYHIVAVPLAFLFEAFVLLSATKVAQEVPCSASH
jgi:hypothetical protein